MREILFRGKRISNGEWVYGGIMKVFNSNFKSESEEDLINFVPNCYSICADGRLYPVHQESIGQYTGLDDKNGKKIFEGDIVKVFDRPRNRDVFGLIKFGKFAFNVLFYIDWEKTLTGSNILMTELGYWHDKIEIIGNKFENPELVEVEE